MKTSNKFTLARIIGAPVLFVIYNLPRWLHAPDGSPVAIACMCALIPLLAAVELTDYFDGHFARKHHEVSDFGKMFDPFADVFLHLSLFTCFLQGGYLPIVLYVIILYREFSQNFLRMVAARQGTAVAARKGGKLKTVFYVISCFFAILQEALVRTSLAARLGLDMGMFRIVGMALFALSALLACLSFIDYLRAFGPVLKKAAE